MDGRSPPFNNSRFSVGTPNRNPHQGARQPVYLNPNCNYMSPRGSRIPSPRNHPASPDFIPLGVSSPVNRARQSWGGQRNNSNNSSISGWSSPPSSNSSLNFSPYNGPPSSNSSLNFSPYNRPPSSNSSHNFSPYNRRGSRGKFNGRSFNNSNNHDNSSWISPYIEKEALENPWAELEKKMNLTQHQPSVKPAEQENMPTPTIAKSSDSDFSSGGSDMDNDNED